MIVLYGRAMARPFFLRESRAMMISITLPRLSSVLPLKRGDVRDILLSAVVFGYRRS